MAKTFRLTTRAWSEQDGQVWFDFLEKQPIVAPSDMRPVGIHSSSTTNPLLVTSLTNYTPYDFEYVGRISVTRVGTVEKYGNLYHADYVESLNMSKTTITAINPSFDFWGNSISIDFGRSVSYNSIAGKKIAELLTAGDKVYGTEFSDVLRLTHKSEKAYGGDGSDNISGRGGNDYLAGGNGNDAIHGGDGNDRLEGHAGADKVKGGAGADTFLFKSISHSTPTSRDFIQDFSRHEGDKVDLSAIDANTKVAGNQAFKLIGDDDFHKKAGELRYEQKSNGTYIYGDVNGDGKVDFSIKVGALVDFVKGDFIL